MSSVITSYSSTDADLTLNEFKVRVDSNSNNVQISTTGTTIDVLYTTNKCDPATHSATTNSDSLSGVSTTPTTLYDTAISTVNEFVHVSLTDMTYLIPYTIRVACVDPTPLYMISISKK